jgi:hypothetical protein
VVEQRGSGSAKTETASPNNVSGSGYYQRKSGAAERTQGSSSGRTEPASRTYGREKEQSSGNSGAVIPQGQKSSGGSKSAAPAQPQRSGGDSGGKSTRGGESSKGKR